MADDKRARLKLNRFRIGQAILYGTEVYMSYDGGTVPRIPRPIIPKTWGTEPLARTILEELCSTGDHHHRYFRALCLNSNMIKTFAMHKVLEVRSFSWELQEGADHEDDEHYVHAVRMGATRARVHDTDEDGEFAVGDEEDEEEDEDEEEVQRYPWHQWVQWGRDQFAEYEAAVSRTSRKSQVRRPSPPADKDVIAEARCCLRDARVYISPAGFPPEAILAAGQLILAHGGAIAPSFDANNRMRVTHMIRVTDFQSEQEFMDTVRNGVTVENCDFLQGIVDVYGDVSQYLVFEYLYDRQHGIKRDDAVPPEEAVDLAPEKHHTATDYEDYYGQGEDKYMDYAYGPSASRTLTYMVNGKRFWQILLDDRMTKVSFGSIGKKARKPLVKEHGSKEDAYRHMVREVKQKAAKGYQEVLEPPQEAFSVYEPLPVSQSMPEIRDPPKDEGRSLGRSMPLDGRYKHFEEVQGDEGRGRPMAQSSLGTVSTRSTRSTRSSLAAGLDRYSQMPIVDSSDSPTLSGGDPKATPPPQHDARDSADEAYDGQHELERFLRKHQLVSYAPEFFKHELSKTDLLHVPVEVLAQQIGIKKLGHRSRLMRAVEALREGPTRTPSPDPSASGAKEHNGHYSTSAAVVDRGDGEEEYEGMETVKKWLASLRLERYLKCFVHEEMDLESMLALTDVKQLAQLGIDKMGPQNKLLRAIEELRAGGLEEWLAKEGVKSDDGDEAVQDTPSAANAVSSDYVVDRSEGPATDASAVAKQPNASRKHIVRDVELGERVGAGHFGEVFKGVWQDQMDVALKRISKEDSEGMREFEAEASVLMDLRHPNIVTFYGVYVDKTEQQFIVLEWANLGGLDSYLRKNSHRTVSFGDLLGFAIDAARGMMYLSELATPVVHRDLALRNLLLTKMDARLQVKVGDFGLSRATNFSAEDEEDQVYMTAHQTAMPIKWIAPETVHTRSFSSRSDVWSFGIVLWEIFSFGGVPYPRMTSREVLAQLRCGYRMKKPTLCSAEVYDVMLHCWHDDPFLRPTFRNIYNILQKLKKDYELQLQEAATAASVAADASADTPSVATGITPSITPEQSFAAASSTSEDDQYDVTQEAPDAAPPAHAAAESLGDPGSSSGALSTGGWSVDTDTAGSSAPRFAPFNPSPGGGSFGSAFPPGAMESHGWGSSSSIPSTSSSYDEHNQVSGAAAAAASAAAQASSEYMQYDAKGEAAAGTRSNKPLAASMYEAVAGAGAAGGSEARSSGGEASSASEYECTGAALATPPVAESSTSHYDQYDQMQRVAPESSG